MRPDRQIQLARAQDAADDLVAALREHDLEGAALIRAQAASRLLRAWRARDRTGDVEALNRAVERVRVICAARRLHQAPPVRRALTRFSVAADDTLSM
jgi:hypothetical protein